MAGENQKIPETQETPEEKEIRENKENELSIMTSVVDLWGERANYNSDQCAKEQTYFQLGEAAYTENGTFLQNLDDNLIPENELETYKKIQKTYKVKSSNINTGAAVTINLTELGRTHNSGFVPLGVMQYMLDHESVTLTEALNPKFDVEEKRKSGLKILDLLGNAESEPEKLGQVIADMAKKISRYDYVGEILRSLELPEDVSDEVFLAAMESPENRLTLLPTVRMIRNFTISAKQSMQGYYAPGGYVSFEKKEGFEMVDVHPARAIYEAAYKNMDQNDRDIYSKWKLAQGSLLDAIALDACNISDIKTGRNGVIASTSMVYSALARKEVVRFRSFMDVDPEVMEFFDGRAGRSLPEDLSPEEIQSAVFQGFSSDRAMKMLGYLPSDAPSRVYFGAATLDESEDVSKRMAGYKETTMLPDIDNFSTNASLINLMMLADGYDIAKNIIPNTLHTTEVKRAYAEMFETYLKENPVLIEQPDGISTINVQSVQKLSVIYTSGVEFCSKYRFPDNFGDGPIPDAAQTDILRVAELIAIDTSKVFGEGLGRIPSFIHHIGGREADKKMTDTLKNFKEVIRPLAECRLSNSPMDKIANKIQADFIKPIIAGQTIADLNQLYPNRYLASLMTTINTNIFKIPGVVSAADNPENQAQIDAFLNGGPLPAFLNEAELHKAFADAFVLAQKEHGVPHAQMTDLIPSYAVQVKLNPATDYTCISEYMEQFQNRRATEKLAMTILLDAMSQTTRSMTADQAKAMYPEDLTELLMVEATAAVQEVIAEKMLANNLDSVDPQAKAEIDECVAGGPLPSFLDKKALDDALKTATRSALTRYSSMYGTQLTGVNMLETSNMADNLPTTSTDRVFFGFKTKAEATAFGRDLSRQPFVNYLASLNNGATRASFARLALLADGGDIAEAVFSDTPEANSLKAEYGAVVKNKLINHKPVFVDQGGAELTRTEDITWYANLFKRSADYLLNTTIPDALDYQAPENAEAKRRAAMISTMAQDHAQIMKDNIKSLLDFRAAVQGDPEEIQNRVSDFAAINQLITTWNNPQRPMAFRMCDKILVDMLKDAVCGKSMQEIVQTFPTGYFYSLVSSAETQMVAVYDKVCNAPENQAALEDFLKNGNLPDFISKDRLERVIDNAKKYATNYAEEKNPFMPDLKMADYQESVRMVRWKAEEELNMQTLFDTMADPDSRLVEKCLIKLAIESLGMSIEEAQRLTSKEYVSLYLSVAASPAFGVGGDLAYFWAGLDREAAEKETRAFLNGNGKLPYFLAAFEPRIKEYFKAAAEEAMRDVNKMGQQLDSPLPIRLPNYEKCPSPPELVGLSLVNTKAGKITVPVNELYKQTLFELDVKRLTAEAIRDGSKAFDEMTAAQFPGLEETLKNPMVAKSLATTLTQLFYIDGKPAEEYILKNVDDIGKYSDAEKDVLRKVGIMQALSSGEHVVEVIKPGIHDELANTFQENERDGAVITKLQRVDMNLSAFNGMEKWYQSSREKKQEQTDIKYAPLFADIKNREKAMAAGLRDHYVALREVGFWERETPGMDSKCISSYFPLKQDMLRALFEGKKYETAGLPQETQDLYNRFETLQTKHKSELVEYFRGDCGGFGNLALMQYLVDHKDATLCDALNPDFDSAAKLEAGEKLLKLVEMAENEPEKLGEAIASYPRRLCKLNFRNELLQLLGLPKDAPEDKFRENLNARRPKVVAFMSGLAGITVGMHQLFGKCYTTTHVEINKAGVALPETQPAKKIYEALLNAREPGERESYAKWGQAAGFFSTAAKQEKTEKSAYYFRYLKGRSDDKKPQPVPDSEKVQHFQSVLDFIVEDRDIQSASIEEIYAFLGHTPEPEVLLQYAQQPTPQVVQPTPDVVQPTPEQPTPEQPTPEAQPTQDKEPEVVPPTPDKEASQPTRQRLLETNGHAAQLFADAFNGNGKKSLDINGQTQQKEKNREP